MNDTEVYSFKRVRALAIQKYVLLNRFAKAIGETPYKLSLKLNGFRAVTRQDMEKWAKALDIRERDYGYYFFEKQTTQK